MKGRIKKNEFGLFVVEYSDLNGYKNIEINPKQINLVKEGFLVDFEEIKINPLGRKVDPMNLSQNQSSCRWVANILQQYDENQDKKIYSEIESEIISWRLDGSKTAGFLTRKIINIINKKNKK